MSNKVPSQGEQGHSRQLSAQHQISSSKNIKKKALLNFRAIKNNYVVKQSGQNGNNQNNVMLVSS